jgi:non-homologous end joining protein Ku
MRSVKQANIVIGFVQVPINLYKAAKPDKLNLKSLCTCGKPPKMHILCPTKECGELIPKDQIPSDVPVIHVDSESTLIPKRYSSWFGVPDRGYQYANGEFITLSKEELDKVAESRKKYDSLTVVKMVDFKTLSMRYALEDAYFGLPPEDANEAGLKAYSLIVETLDQKGSAMLSYLSIRDKVHRVVILADKDQGILMVYKLSERRDIPYAVSQAEVNEGEKAQISQILEAVKDDDVTLDPPEDPIFDLIKEKVEKQYHLNGLGQTTLGAGEEEA